MLAREDLRLQLKIIVTYLQQFEINQKLGWMSFLSISGLNHLNGALLNINVNLKI